MRLRTILTYAVFLVLALPSSAQWDCNPPDALLPQWRGNVPEPVFPDSSLIRLYEKAWDIASGRVRRGPKGLTASPYLDENCYDDQIWIWDGCFMVHFSKYAPEQFPGKETLSNYYAPLHDGALSPLRIHLRDNPPLFAWTELENIRHTGDSSRLEFLRNHRYLEKHYDFYNALRKGQRDKVISPLPIFTTVHRDDDGQPVGYTSIGNSSGMDNTPRGRGAGGWDSIMWVDAVCQQALAARSMEKIARLNSDSISCAKWNREWQRLRDVVNNRYWDDKDGFYYDIDILTGKPVKVATVGSFWSLMAEIPDSARAARMAAKLLDREWFGGDRPWNSLARHDADFDSITGNYWRGGIWIPMAYMGTKALEKYGMYRLADSLAYTTVKMMARVYEQTEPHTIWETYSPVADAPSTEHGHTVRQEFCGWSALGPISLFIENILGFRHADGLSKTLVWDLDTTKGSHGIRNLRFGRVNASAVFDASTKTVSVNSNVPFTLILNGMAIPINEGGKEVSLLEQTP